MDIVQRENIKIMDERFGKFFPSNDNYYITPIGGLSIQNGIYREDNFTTRGASNVLIREAEEENTMAEASLSIALDFLGLHFFKICHEILGATKNMSQQFVTQKLAINTHFEQGRDNILKFMPTATEDNRVFKPELLYNKVSKEKELEDKNKEDKKNKNYIRDYFSYSFNNRLDLDTTYFSFQKKKKSV